MNKNEPPTTPAKETSPKETEICDATKATNDVESLLDNLRLLLGEHQKAEEKLKSSILNAFAVVDDHRSGAYEVRQEIETMNSLLLRWATLSHKEKDSFSNRIYALRNGRLSSGVKPEYNERLKQIEQVWHGCKRADALVSFAQLREQLKKVEDLSIIERRTLLKTAKRLRRKNRIFFEKQERNQLADLIAVIRKGMDARWWEFWVRR